MATNDPGMSLYRWTPKKEMAVTMLACGHTIDETAETVGVSEKTIDRWKRDIEFSVELDRLSLMTDVASRAERLRIAKRIIRDRLRQRKPSERDLLDWIKYVQSETDGAKLDLTALLEIASFVADAGQDRTGEVEDDDTGHGGGVQE